MSGGLGRRQLRQAIAGWFAPPNVPGLALVLPAMPKLIQGQQMWTPDVQGTGAAAYVTLARDSQHRIAIGGALSGQKLRTYQARLNLASRTDTADSTADQGVVAMDAFDDLVEGIIGRILTDRTMGATVWQAGEGDRLFGEDIVVSQPSALQTAEAGSVWVFGDVTWVLIDALVNT